MILSRGCVYVLVCCLAGCGVSLLTGCTITTDGIQTMEVPIEEIFPPSKAVASYRQVRTPVKLNESEMEAQFGGAQKLAIVRKWGTITTLGTEYGIPERPAKARVSVTEMSSKQNAYGAYSNLRPGLLNETNYIKIGVHATVEGERLVFVQDRFVIVIRDLSNSQDPARRTMLINFARAISNRIPRDITDIAVIGYLPFEHRVPATERLDKEDPLGLGLFKAGGVTALYRIESRECKVFLAELGGGYEVKDLMGDIKKVMEKEGPLTTTGIGAEGYQGRLFKLTALLSRRENVVFGCYGTMTDKEMKNVMSGIDRRIKPYVPSAIKNDTREKDDEDAKKRPGGG